MDDFMERVTTSAYMMTLPLDVAGGPAAGLDQGAGRAQETFFVRIQNRHQGDFGYIKTFPQKVDSHQHIEIGPFSGP